MLNPSSENIEKVILHNIQKLQDGDPEARTRVCRALQAVSGPEHEALLPLLRSLIKVDDVDMKVFGCIALGALREAAAPATSDLLTIANDTNGFIAMAGICSLGLVPGKESLEGLVSLYERNQNGLLFDSILSAIRRHGDAVEPYISRLEFTTSELSPMYARQMNEILNDIRNQIRYNPSNSLTNTDMSSSIQLYVRHAHRVSMSEHYAQYQRDLPEGAGLVVNEPVIFRTGRPRLGMGLLQGDQADPDTTFGSPQSVSSFRLQIYRSREDTEKTVVAFVVDENFYGTSPQNLVEELATAVHHLYGLNPEQTTWVENWTAASGATRMGIDESFEVHMAFDHQKAQYDRPKWTKLESFEAFLDDRGAR